jgi:hypothetical protein
LNFAESIDYRDFAVTGDAKYVWEPSRHHHLVVLGRAYRASGDPSFADALVEQLGSWLDQSPYGRGMNWRSPLELGIRLINWVWALDLIGESRLLTEGLRTRVLRAIHLHLWDITRKYSRGSSANNHRIGGRGLRGHCLLPRTGSVWRLAPRQPADADRGDRGPDLS